LRQNNVRVWRICVTASEKSFLNVGFAPNFVGRFVSVPTPAIRGVAEKCLNGLNSDLRCIVRERPLSFVSLDILSDSETPSGVAGQRPPEVRALFGLGNSGAACRCHGRVRGKVGF
jgi:hypothetical protein